MGSLDCVVVSPALLENLVVHPYLLIFYNLDMKDWTKTIEQKLSNSGNNSYSMQLEV